MFLLSLVGGCSAWVVSVHSQPVLCYKVDLSVTLVATSESTDWGWAASVTFDQPIVAAEVRFIRFRIIYIRPNISLFQERSHICVYYCSLPEFSA